MVDLEVLGIAVFFVSLLRADLVICLPRFGKFL